MTSRPYDAAEQVDDSLVFIADLPAFVPIGRRYAEVEDARLDFTHSQDTLDYWTGYVAAYQQATADAIAGRRPWPELVAEMSQRYPKEFPPSLDRVPPAVLKNRETPEGQKYYLEWIAQTNRFLLLAKQMEGQKGQGNTKYAKRVRAERKKLLPAGRYKFDCGDRDEPTENQKALFDRLQSTQAEIFREVAGALAELYALCRGHCAESELSDPYVQTLFPADASGDIPLDRFRIQSFLLHPTADEIGLSFDSMFDWCEEHGCAVLVSEGKVPGECWGGDDVLFSFYEE